MSDSTTTPTPPPPPPPAASPPPPAPPPPAGGSGGEVSPNRTVMLVLSYLWLLALIPLLVEKNDSEVQWHAKHGLVLLVAEFLAWIGITVVTMLLGDFLGCLVGFLSLFLWLGILILHVVMIVKAVGGGRLLIPGLSDYANRF